MSIAGYLHVFFEIISVILLFVLYYLNSKKNISGHYSRLMSMGFLAAAVSDIIHSVMTIYPVFVPFWEPFTWASSRFALIFCFLLITIDSYVKTNIKEWKSYILFWVIFIPTTLITLGSAIYINFIDLEFVYQTGIIHRPLDFILMILWIIVGVLLFKHRFYLFPPYSFWPFMTWGILLHAIMTFGSEQSLDIAFQLAHIFKLLEYSILILLYSVLIKWVKTDEERRIT